MAYLNKIQLMGNSGKEPEVRLFNTGDKVASFSLATTKTWNDSKGQRQSSTIWHNIQAYGRLAELAEKYIKKGTPLYVEGEYTSRDYTAKDGSNRTVYEVKATNIQLLGSKAEGESQESAAPASAPKAVKMTPDIPVDNDLPF